MGSNSRTIEDSEDEDQRKIMRIEYESRGDIGMVMEIDAIKEDDWEEEKQHLRESRLQSAII